MHTRDFYYDLPAELIAQYPLSKRSSSRLLCLTSETGKIEDQRFSDLLFKLRPGDLLVFNNTRVVPARLFGVKKTGGKIEVLVERQLNEHHILAQIRASKSPKPLTNLILEGELEVQVIGRQDEFYILQFLDPRPVPQLLDLYGHIPLPPYISRDDAETDRERYQTVYAKKPGAIAAPTAGLHFDKALLESLAQAGIESTYLTLHVGAGTFQPVRVADIHEHRMHEEYVEVGQGVCDAVQRCRQKGGRIVAVGTTTVRSLETATQNGVLKPFRGNTRMFITPGFSFQVVNAMITNFHLPESTLLMLVSAFGGHHQVMQAYRHAVDQRYRFYSYGDAMLITRNQGDVCTGQKNNKEKYRRVT